MSFFLSIISLFLFFCNFVFISEINEEIIVFEVLLTVFFLIYLIFLKKRNINFCTLGFRRILGDFKILEILLLNFFFLKSLMLRNLFQLYFIRNVDLNFFLYRNRILLSFLEK